MNRLKNYWDKIVDPKCYPSHYFVAITIFLIFLACILRLNKPEIVKSFPFKIAMVLFCAFILTLLCDYNIYVSWGLAILLTCGVIITIF